MLQTIGNTSMSCTRRNVYEGRRLLIVVLYGGMGGIISAGILHALEKQGISPHNNPRISVIGVSAGAANVLGFCAGRAGESLRIYGELADHIKKRSWLDLNKVSDILEVGHLTEILKKELGHDFLNKCEGNAYAALTRERDGEGELHNLKTADCPFAVTHASMCMPVLLQGSVQVGNEQFVDGACSASLAQMVRLVRPQNILIVGSRPLYGELPPGESALSKHVLRGLSAAYPLMVREKSVRTDEVLQEGLIRIGRAKKINVCGIFPESQSSIAWDQIDQKILKAAFWKAFSSTLKLD